MVQDAPARCHAACRDDQLGHRISVEGFRLFHLTHIARDSTGPAAGLLAEPVHGLVLTEYLARVDRHGTIQKDRDCRDTVTTFEPLDVVKQRLRATDRKGRYDHRTAPWCGSIDDLGQGILRIARVMEPIAVSRFDHEKISVPDDSRVDHGSALRTTEITGKNDFLLGGTQLDDCGTKDVTRGMKAGA